MSRNAKFNLISGRLAAIHWEFALVLLILAALMPRAALGLGVRIPNQDPEAIARGNAVAATADNPSAIYYNPAGITQSEGQNVQVGDLNYLGINTSFDSATGGHADSKFHILPVPEVYYTASFEGLPLSFGFGVYAPFGLGVEWPDNSGFRSLDVSAKLQYITLNPVIAWKVHRTLSLAVGPTFNYSQIDITRGLLAPTDLLEFKGSGIAYGFNAGVLWQPCSKWSFGANYRSASIMDYSGTTSYNPAFAASAAHTTAQINYPQIISGGVSFRPTPKWNFEVDVDWTDWDSVKTLTLSGTKNLGFPTDLALPLNWHGSWFYELGGTRYFENGWFVSAGYFFSSETTSEQYFNPAVPDTDLHVGSLGFGHKGEHWRWALAGQIIAGPQRVVSDSQPNPFTGESANGKYQLIVPTVSFSVGYHF